MSTNILRILIFIAQIGLVTAQSVTYDYFGNRVIAVTSDDITSNGYLPSEAIPIVQNILRYTGLEVKIRVQQEDSKTNFAFAKILNNTRYIFYNSSFLRRVSQGGNWDATSIMAHEVGHHLSQHSENDPQYFQNELAADRFSGFVLAKMGASLADAQKAINTYTVQTEDSDQYPGKPRRLAAIREGWLNGRGGGPFPPPFPIVKDISKVKGAMTSRYSFRKDKTDYYEFKLSLTGIDDIKSSISKVVYDFNHSSYTNRYITVTDKSTNFLYVWNGWGCIYNLGVHFYFVDGTTDSMNIDMCSLWN